MITENYVISHMNNDNYITRDGHDNDEERKLIENPFIYNLPHIQIN